MNLTDLELEQVRHIDTRRALAKAQAQAIEQDATMLGLRIQARLGLTGAWSIGPNGEVVTQPEPAT